MSTVEKITQHVQKLPEPFLNDENEPVYDESDLKETWK